MRLVGFNGACGLSDGTHIGILQCLSWASIGYLSHKLATPSRNYNVTVTHCCQILSTICGYPGTHNDKTLIMRDELIRRVHKGTQYSRNTFKLLELGKEKKK